MVSIIQLIFISILEKLITFFYLQNIIIIYYLKYSILIKKIILLKILNIKLKIFF